MRVEKTPDIIIGRRRNLGRVELFGISNDDRYQHKLAVGKSGVGKSTFLFNLALQDILAGRGVAVIPLRLGLRTPQDDSGFGQPNPADSLRYVGVDGRMNSSRQIPTASPKLSIGDHELLRSAKLPSHASALSFVGDGGLFI